MSSIKSKTVIGSQSKNFNPEKVFLSSVQKRIPFNTQTSVINIHSMALFYEKDQALKSLNELDNLEFESEEEDNDFKDSKLSDEFDSSRFSTSFRVTKVIRI